MNLAWTKLIVLKNNDLSGKIALLNNYVKL